MKQAGNALFLILIAVALFAALSYAVTQSGRGGGSIDREQASLNAAQLVQYSDIVANGIQKGKILFGLADNQYCFDSAEWGYNDYYASATCDNPEMNVFSQDGLGVSFARPDESWLDPTHSAETRYGEYIYDRYNIEGIGTEGLTTTSADLLLFALYLKRDICISINENLGIANPSGEPPVENNQLNLGHFRCVGGLSGSACYGSNASPNFIDGSGNELAGQMSGCLQGTNVYGDTAYFYYRVLLAR